MEQQLDPEVQGSLNTKISSTQEVFFSDQIIPSSQIHFHPNFFTWPPHQVCGPYRQVKPSVGQAMAGIQNTRDGLILRWLSDSMSRTIWSTTTGTFWKAIRHLCQVTKPSNKSNPAVSSLSRRTTHVNFIFLFLF